MKTNNPNILCIGGGTGLSTLLCGFRNYPGEINAIVSTTDNGGSSGKIRGECDFLAYGDMRRCISALIKNSDHANLMEYRFDHESIFAGHTVGNIILSSLFQRFRNSSSVNKYLSSFFCMNGTVYPMCEEENDIIGYYYDGKAIYGENSIGKYDGRIKKIELRNKDPAVNEDIADKIKKSNVIVIGPGSLFTSVIPPLLVPEIVRAIILSTAKIVYVSNLFQERNETKGFSLEDHVDALYMVHPDFRIDYILYNEENKEQNMSTNIVPMLMNEDYYEKKNIKVIKRKLSSVEQPLLHNSVILRKEILNI